MKYIKPLIAFFLAFGMPIALYFSQMPHQNYGFVSMRHLSSVILKFGPSGCSNGVCLTDINYQALGLNPTGILLCTMIFLLLWALFSSLKLKKKV